MNEYQAKTGFGRSRAGRQASLTYNRNMLASSIPNSLKQWLIKNLCGKR